MLVLALACLLVIEKNHKNICMVCLHLAVLDLYSINTPETPGDSACWLLATNCFLQQSLGVFKTFRNFQYKVSDRLYVYWHGLAAPPEILALL